MPEGRESPPPERQTDKQLNQPASEGFGTTKGGDGKKESLKSQLDNLESNPKGPIDDAVKQKFSKETGN